VTSQLVNSVDTYLTSKYNLSAYYKLGLLFDSYCSLTYMFPGEKDPAPVFFNSNVQNLLKKLTRVDLRTVFRTRRYGVALKAPEYK